MFWKLSIHIIGGWDKDYRVNLLNSFIVAKRNNKIVNTIKDIFFNYWMKKDVLIEYFLMQILFDELMRIDEYKNLNCDIISDFIPHKMQHYRDLEYSDDLWDFIVSDCSIHKLSYQQCNSGTIFEHALSLYLN